MCFECENVITYTCALTCVGVRIQFSRVISLLWSLCGFSDLRSQTCIDIALIHMNLLACPKMFVTLLGDFLS